MDLFSIIIPVYNAEKTLKRCLESVKNQNYDKFECIIVNDGSTDGSLGICKQYVNYDRRFRLFSTNNGGVSKARNLGLKEVNGKWILFLDSDDMFDEDLLYTLSVVQEECELISFGNNDIVPKAYKGTVNGYINNVKDQLSLLRPVWGKAFKRQIISQANLEFNEQMHLGEDYLFVLQYLQEIKNPIICVDKPLYRYDNVSSTLSRKHYPVNTIINIEKHIVENINKLKIEHDKRVLLLKDRRKSILDQLYYSVHIESFGKRKKVLVFINMLTPFPPINNYYIVDMLGMLKHYLKIVKERFYAK